MNNRESMKIKPLTIVFVIAVLVISVFLFQLFVTHSSAERPVKEDYDSLSLTPVALFSPEQVWTAPDVSTIPNDEQGKLILYGRTLLLHTSKYFGPHGTISASSNGM